MNGPARHHPSRPRWAALAVLGLGAVLLGWVLFFYRPAPTLPADRDHRQAQVPQGCLVCHGPGGTSPRDPNHPISEACFSCHRW